MRKDWDDVAYARRETARKAIDEAIMALVVEAMLQEFGGRGERCRGGSLEVFW